MSQIRNVLFIMCDQLRWDYLSCYGHPALHTPHIDALARRGVRFTRAYAQSPVCGPSRMSFYTGRYVSSHRSSWNFVPLPVDEMTLGDHLEPSGISAALVGKTHFEADMPAIRSRRIPTGTERGRLLMEGGFEAFDRSDGVFVGSPCNEFLKTPYAAHLARHGFGGGNAWHDWVNSAVSIEGEILSGWELRHAHLPARIPEHHSETAYATERAIEYIRSRDKDPWCLHLSYIKPHWPYVAPTPYHDLYRQTAIAPAISSPSELEDPHPVYAAFTQRKESLSFSSEAVRQHVIPTYMGLIKQVDDHIGRLCAFLESSGHRDDTLIVFTSDHGDYLGDHHLGEKELFHDASARIPLIVVDPSSAAAATRGCVNGRLVEAIDIVPTIMDALGLEVPGHIIEGRSLLPLLRRQPVEAWRDVVVSELDYGFRTDTVELLGRRAQDCHATMLFDGRYKYIHYDGYRPQLFDLESDPDELVDLGKAPDLVEVRQAFESRLFLWLRERKSRKTIPDAFIEGYWTRSTKAGIELGAW